MTHPLNVIDAVTQASERKDIVHLTRTQKGNIVGLRFILEDVDGSRASGCREFPVTCTFEDVDDFVNELWYGKLFEEPAALSHS